MRRALFISPLVASLLGSVALLVWVIGGAGTSLVRSSARAAVAPEAASPAGRLSHASKAASPSTTPAIATLAPPSVKPAGAIRHKRRSPEHLLLQRQVVANLAELRSRIAPCDDRDTPRAPGESGADGERALAETVLVLEIELLDGQMQIVDAPVQAEGSASSAFVACAQRGLRGQILPARAAKAGERIRMLLGLGIRGGAVGPEPGSSRRSPAEAAAVTEPMGIDDLPEIDADEQR